MKCASCGTENRDDAPYCNLCKAAFTRAAPAIEGAVPVEPPTEIMKVHAPPPAAPEAAQELRQGLADALELLVAVMPPGPAEERARLPVPIDFSRWPAACASCGAKKEREVQVRGYWPGGAAFVVPLCRGCERRAQSRRRHAAARAVVMGLLLLVSLPIHGFFVGLAFLDLSRALRILITRRWQLGARPQGWSPSDERAIPVEIDDRAYARLLQEALAAPGAEAGPPAAPSGIPAANGPGFVPPPVARGERREGGVGVTVSPVPASGEPRAVPSARPAPREPLSDRSVSHGSAPAAPVERAPIEIHTAPPRTGPVAVAGLDPRAVGQVDAFTREGEALVAEKRYVQSLVKFEAALALLPEPHDQHVVAGRIYAAMGDAYFRLGDWAETVRCMSVALECPEGIGDPYLLLRRGQAQLELGQVEPAAESLASAYLGGGKIMFENEDPKYLSLVEQKLARA